MTALITAVSLIIFVIEAQLPSLTPIPGIKLGLANIAVLFALYALGPTSALFVLVLRIIMGGIFTGQMMAVLYSFAGGILAYLIELLLYKRLNKNHIWVVSVFGAIMHNVGQILVAILITSTVQLVVYLPVLIISGIITGAFTGLCAQFLLKRLETTKILKQ